MTRTARSSKLNSHTAEPIIEMHCDDAAALGIEQGMLATVASRCGDVLVRVQISAGQQQGNVFIPIHWNQQFASNGRVDVLVDAHVDPISGQPEFKHTPVSVTPYQAVWHGFILSRQPLKLSDPVYWVRLKGQQFWRYELAGDTIIDKTESWARQQLGNDGDWLEFEDQALGCYRAVKIQDGKLGSVVFIAADHDLPSRAWLSQLFANDSITDEQRVGLLAGRPGAGLPDVGALICACFGVGENTIIDVINNDKSFTVEKIGDCLKAGTNCGSCIPELKTLLANNT
jgi:assimilatory nitrate reductase catalytic subunit